MLAALLGVIDGTYRASIVLSALAVSFLAVALLGVSSRPWRVVSPRARAVAVGLVGAAVVWALVVTFLAVTTVRNEVFAESDRGVRAVVALDDRLIAVGTDQQNRVAVWVSNDGEAWERASNSPELTDIDVRSADVFQGRVMVAGQTTDTDEGVVLMSDDGHRWVRNPTFGDPLNPETSPVAIAASADSLAMVGDTYGNAGVFWHSVDGSGWEVTEPLPVFDRGDRLWDIVATTEGFVAVGQDGDGGLQAWTSRDGARWNSHDLDHSGDDALVAAHGDTVVIGANTGAGAVLWTSSASIAWNRADDGMFAEHDIDAISESQEGFVAVGRSHSNAEVRWWSSPDGTVWRAESVDQEPFTRAEIHTLVPFRDVMIAAGYDVAAEGAAFWRGTGSTWTKVELDPATTSLD